MDADTLKRAKETLNDAITRWLAGDPAAGAQVEEAMREAESLRQPKSSE